MAVLRRRTRLSSCACHNSPPPEACRAQTGITLAAINGKVDYLRGLKENAIMAALFHLERAWKSTGT